MIEMGRLWISLDYVMKYYPYTHNLYAVIYSALRKAHANATPKLVSAQWQTGETYSGI